jgi:hypothetical protein
MQCEEGEVNEENVPEKPELEEVEVKRPGYESPMSESPLSEPLTPEPSEPSVREPPKPEPLPKPEPPEPSIPEPVTPGPLLKPEPSELPIPEPVTPEPWPKPEPPELPIPEPVTPEPWPKPEPSEPPLSEPPSSKPPPPELVPERRISPKMIRRIGGGALALLLLCVVVGAVLSIPYVRGTRVLPIPPNVIPGLVSERVLVAFPGRRGDDLYLLRPGEAKSEGTLLVEDATRATITFSTVRDARSRGALGGEFGGFVPGLDWLFLWRAGEGEVLVQQMRTGDPEPVDVLNLEGVRLAGTVFGDRQAVFLVEHRTGRVRCYMATPGRLARRLAWVDRCTISADGSTAFLEEVYGDELSLSAIDVNGKNQTLLLDDAEGIKSYRVSDDGAHLAYVRAEGEDRRLYLVDRRTADQVQVGDEAFEFADYGFAPGGEVLFYRVRETSQDDVFQLYTSESDRPIAQGAEIQVGFSPDGRHLVYMVRDDATSSLRVRPLGKVGEVEVWSGEGVDGYEIAHTSPPRLIVPVVKEPGFTLLSAALDGTGVVQLVGEDGGTLKGIWHVDDEPTLYVQVEGQDGSNALFVTPVDRAEAIRLLDGWAEIDLLNRGSKGQRLLFQGRRDGEEGPILYSVDVGEGVEPIVLDERHQGFENAVFATNGRFVLYTAILGDEPDAVDVCRVRVDSEEGFETLYEKAFLVDVHWDDLDPF